MMESFAAKIKTFTEIASLSRQWKDSGATVVFTNGCFDLLHYGHLHYLTEAKALGDKLIVGLNSTASVRRLKGPERPINDEATRMYLLAALSCVDAVVVFEEDTPLDLITVVLPDLLVKGGDYKPKDIVGAKVVLENGGEVKVLGFAEGYSSTALEQKMKEGK
jgi:D-glycero-beta-D-manno-heptose 1-phosphate adenylyltransferase